ncbi:glycosyltransferase, partial [Actinocorallia lasiicapitis]
IRSADLVLALQPDPFALDALRAMACGVPVVAVRSGGHGDAVVEDVTGTLLDRTAPHALAAVLRDLLGDPTRRLAYGLAGEDRARSRHSWERVAAETHRLYLAAHSLRRPS